MKKLKTLVVVVFVLLLAFTIEAQERGIDTKVSIKKGAHVEILENTPACLRLVDETGYSVSIKRSNNELRIVDNQGLNQKITETDLGTTIINTDQIKIDICDV